MTLTNIALYALLFALVGLLWALWLLIRSAEMIGALLRRMKPIGKAK